MVSSPFAHASSITMDIRTLLLDGIGECSPPLAVSCLCYKTHGRATKLPSTSLGPRPFPRMRQNLERGRRKGVYGRNVGAVRMECNYTMSGSDMQNKLAPCQRESSVLLRVILAGFLLSGRSR